MDFYQKFLLKTLGNKINKKLQPNEQIDITSEDEVMANINVLLEKVDKIEFGSPTGESFSYLPKEDKISIMRLISATAALTSNVEWLFATKDGYVPRSDDSSARRVLRATAALYYDRNDTRPIATYQKIYEFDRIIDEGVSYEDSTIEQRSNVEGRVRGIAETRCLSKFGIGEWFENEDDPEKKLSDIDQGNSPISQIALPKNTADTVNNVAESAQEEVPFENVVADPLSISFSVPSIETPASIENPIDTAESPKKRGRKPKTETAATTTEESEQISTATLTLSLEEAKQVKATIGLAASKGLTLGEIAADEGMKVTNLKYIYIRSHNAKEKEAIKVLAHSDDAIMKSFEGDGISLS